MNSGRTAAAISAGLLLVSLLALQQTSGTALAQNQNQVVGIFSQVQDRGDDQSSDPRKLLPHVELLALDPLTTCQQKGFFSSGCPRHEWTAGYTLESETAKLEKDMSVAWNYYDARTYWRIQTDLNQPVSWLVNCGAGFTFDPIYGAWDGNFLATVPNNGFCDGLNISLPLSLPFICGWGDGTLFTDWNRATNSVIENQKHALTTYLPQYSQDVLKSMAIHTPSGVFWNAPEIPGGGMYVQPVTRLTPNFQQYFELAKQAQNIDPRGGMYVMQKYPPNLIPRAFSQAVLRWLPQDGMSLVPDYLPQVEELKYDLATREDILGQPLQWSYFKFPGISDNGPAPSGVTATGLVNEYAAVGQSSFMGVYSQVDAEISPRQPIMWRSCFDLGSWTFVPFPTTLPQMGLPLLTNVASRFHSKWMSIPEGGEIPGVVGLPRY